MDLKISMGKKINICGVVEAIPQIYAESHTWARLWMLSEHPRWCYLKVLPGSKAKVMETVQRMLAEEVPESLDNRIFLHWKNWCRKKITPRNR